VTPRIRRAGDTVRRPAEFWSPAVHGLLRHLEAVGFPSPRVLGTDSHTEVLTRIEGDSGTDGWAKVVPEDGLRRWARFLRRYHDAVSGCVRWLRYPAPPDRRRRIEVFCDAYGIAVPDDVSACVAAQQRMVSQTAEALGRRGIEPQATWIREGRLEEYAARVRRTEAARF
jgi:Phosphotransferase enzyme family